MGNSSDDRSAAQIQALAATLGFVPLVPRHPQQDALDKFGVALAYMRRTPEYAAILERRYRGELTFEQSMDETQKLLGELQRAGRLPGYPPPPVAPTTPPVDPDQKT